MKLTIAMTNDWRFRLDDMTNEEVVTLMTMIKTYPDKAFLPILRSYEETPWNEFPTHEDNGEKLQNLVREVKEMRRLDAIYFKTRTQEILRAAIAQERKVDNLIKQIENMKQYTAPSISTMKVDSELMQTSDIAPGANDPLSPGKRVREEEPQTINHKSVWE